MIPDPLLTVILFSGFNEVELAKGAPLQNVEVNGYEVSLRFKGGSPIEFEYRQFYVHFDPAPVDYAQGILRLLTKIEFSDGTSSALVYEVYPYESA